MATSSQVREFPIGPFRESAMRWLDAVGRGEQGDEAARRAYDVYIHRLRRYVGAYLITLGHVDAICFTAGVGENAAQVRADALAGLERIGIVVDPARSARELLALAR